MNAQAMHADHQNLGVHDIAERQGSQARSERFSDVVFMQRRHQQGSISHEKKLYIGLLKYSRGTNQSFAKLLRRCEMQYHCVKI